MERLEREVARLREQVKELELECSQARLEVLWLARTLERIAHIPCVHQPECTLAGAWRRDATKWAKKVLNERIRELENE